MTTKTMQRYRWAKPSDLPDRIELIDNISSQHIAVITIDGRTYRWRRTTTILLHGAPPTEGNATSLTLAKVRVLDGLPD
jgi:hypothetical protein